tara:strand:- start:2817 stop:3161 length:345 start_codon:yes stop_codon:yes gene_type:complete
MPNIAKKNPASTFKDVLTVNSTLDNEGLEETLKTVMDGEGIASSIQLSSDDFNISTHDYANNGLMLKGILVTAMADEINNLDGKAFGGTSTNDVLLNSSLQTQLTDKSIDGGTF